jgi:hypothetical protein
MTALAAARNTQKLAPGEVVLSMIDIPLKAATKAWQGGILCIDSTGFGVKATAAVGLIACGVLNPQQAATPVLDNTSGSSGDIIARVAQGVFKFANSASADQITQADVGQLCFLVDDQTVSKTDGAGARSPAGEVMGIEGTTSVFVYIALQQSQAVATGISSGSAPLESGVLSGALSVAKRSSTLAVSGTVAYTLADGTRVGQRKTITADTAASTPHGVLTPAHGSGWTSADFTTARGSLELEWISAGWRIVFVGGTVAIT